MMDSVRLCSQFLSMPWGDALWGKGGRPGAVQADASAVAAARKVLAGTTIGAVLVTRSEKGMTLVQRTAEPVHIPTAAREVAEHDDVAAPLDGPLGLSVEFRFPMAQSRPKAVRALGRAWKMSKPDTDKLLRSVGDALTVGGLIVDDARFVAVEAVKVEVTGWTGAIIRITREDGAA